MKFFVPHAADEKQALSVWNAVRAFLFEHGNPTDERKVWRLSFRHNGKSYCEEVGKPAADLKEEVLMILKAADDYPLFYVCTATRGVAGGEPYLVGIDEFTHAADFE